MTKPTKQQEREDGLYWVKWEPHMRWEMQFYARDALGNGFWATDEIDVYNDPAIIGPKITPPQE